MIGYQFRQSNPSKAAAPGTPALQRRSVRSGLPKAQLQVGKPGDRYEQEADHVAKQVMSTPGPRVQRTCSCGGECSKCQKKQGLAIQARNVGTGTSNSTSNEATASVSEALASPGQRLAGSARSFLEPRFGHDFSKVRIHADSRASASAKELGAEAYTVGSDVVFAAGKYAPGTTAGRELLAHELTHVLQQNQSNQPMIQRRTDEQADKGPGVGKRCGPPFPQKEKQAGARCWAAALFSLGNSGSSAGPASGMNHYLEKYKEFTVKDEDIAQGAAPEGSFGALLPWFWAKVAREEGLKTTEEISGDQMTPHYLLRALGALLGSSDFCRPLLVAESGPVFAHAYVVFGIQGYRMIRMDPFIGDYNTVDVRQISSAKKFKVSY